MSRFRLVAALWLLAACAQPAPTPAPTPLAPATVHASFGRTWNAVIDELAQRNIPVQTLDRASGFVAAQAVGVPGGEMRRLTTDCGTFAAFMLRDMGPGSANYNIRVQGDSTESTVKVTLTAAQGSSRCTTKGVFENTIQREVKARAEAK